MFAAWARWEVEIASRNKEAIAAVLDVGGSISYDWLAEQKPRPYPDSLGMWLGDDYLSVVTTITLQGREVTDSGLRDLLAHLEVLQEVRELTIQNCPISNQGLAALYPLSGLESLKIENTNINDEGLIHLTRFPRLRELQLVGNDYPGQMLAQRYDGTFSLRGVACLARLGNIRSLKLLQVSTTDEDLKAIRAFAHRESLELEVAVARGVTDDGIRHLNGLNCLRRLSLSSHHITDTSLPTIGTLTNLTELRLVGSQITNDGLVYLSGLAKLEILDLRRTFVADAGIKHLQQLSSLRDLSLPAQPPPLPAKLEQLRREILVEMAAKGAICQSSGVSTQAAQELRSRNPKIAVGLY